MQQLDAETEQLNEAKLAEAPRPNIDPFSLVVISLLKGVLYKQNDERLWASLVKLQTKVRDYVAVIGLELILDEAEEYAFLRSSRKDQTEDDQQEAPRLVARRPLSFHVSLILALLRKKLAEFDARSGDTRLILTREELVDMVRIFVPEATNDAKLVKQIDTHLNKIVELGFLRKLKTQSQGQDCFEVLRIMKAFIDADWLARLDERLETYRQKLVEEL
jgi:hypothetical protein